VNNESDDDDFQLAPKKICPSTSTDDVRDAVTHKHTHAHIRFAACCILSGTTPGEPVPEETFTHSHLSWSSIIPYLLPPSITIHGIQFTCLTVFFHNLSPSFFWSTSWPGTISSPNHCLLFTAHAHTIATTIGPRQNPESCKNGCECVCCLV